MIKKIILCTLASLSFAKPINLECMMTNKSDLVKYSLYVMLNEEVNKGSISRNTQYNFSDYNTVFDPATVVLYESLTTMDHTFTINRSTLRMDEVWYKIDDKFQLQIISGGVGKCTIMKTKNKI